MLGYGATCELIEPRLIHRTRLITKYKFVKPNDRNALDLMNAAAVAVMKELPDLVLAYGNSDEFRYVGIFSSKSRCRVGDRILETSDRS
jgi:tRNA(His) 5'-end guanylyltransferase